MSVTYAVLLVVLTVLGFSAGVLVGYMVGAERGAVDLIRRLTLGLHSPSTTPGDKSESVQ